MDLGSGHIMERLMIFLTKAIYDRWFWLKKRDWGVVMMHHRMVDILGLTLVSG